MSKKQQTKSKIEPRLWLIIALLFFAAFLPRVLGLDQSITPDEHKWLARSANFYQAISHADWGNTFQREHPGVTVMWAGTLAFWQSYPDYAQEAPGQFTWEDDYLEQWLLENTSHKPLELLAAGRWWIVLAISLTLALSYLPLRRLFGEKVALLALLFVIWEPFHIALSRQLHPDGLSASLTFLALTTFLVWFDEVDNWRYLIFSALVMSLAWLTKSPTILLLPIAGLLIALKGWYLIREQPFRPFADGGNLRSYLAGLLLWSTLSLLIFVLLWPALWLDPLGTLTRMALEVDVYIEGHGRANYFLGQATADPGVLFYPIAYLFRTTPLVLIGLGAAILFAWRQQSPFDEPRTRQLVGALFCFVLLFTIVITAGAKKFDRYLLPAFLCLDVIATLGWIGGIKMAHKGVMGYPPKAGQSSNDVRSSAPSGTPYVVTTTLLAVALILLGHGLPGFLHYPHYLSYYNPLVGGSLTAPQVMMIGWGEGLDKAARYLNNKPNAEQLVVSSWYPLGSFSYFFEGQHTLAPKDIPDPIDNKRHWFSTDYVVFYANQWQRQLPTAELLDYFFAMPPEQVIRIAGLDYARIYNLHNTPINDYLGLRQPPRTDWDNAIRLMALDLSDEPLKRDEPFQVTFYLRNMAAIERDVSALVRLVDSNGNEWGRSEGWPWDRATSSWQLGDTWPDTHQFTLPADAPSTLRLELSFYDPTTLEHLPATDVQTGQPIGDRLLIERAALTSPPRPLRGSFFY